MTDEQSQMEFRKQFETMLRAMEEDLKRAFAEMEVIKRSTQVIRGNNWVAVINLN